MGEVADRLCLCSWVEKGLQGSFPLLAVLGLPGSTVGPSETHPQNWPGPHQLVFDEVTDDFVVEILDGGPADALLYVLLLGAAKGAGVGAVGWAHSRWGKKVGQCSPTQHLIS